MQCPDVAVAGDAPEGEVEVLGRRLLVLAIANHHVRALPAEPRDDPLEADFLPCGQKEKRLVSQIALPLLPYLPHSPILVAL